MRIYHAFTKSIAGFTVFRCDSDYERMVELLKFYRFERPPISFSNFIRLKDKDRFFKLYCSQKEMIIDILAYCIMPTHLHILLSELKEEGISTFMGNILNSYTRYLNTKIKRKGPLWQSRFKRVEVLDDEQLLHLTRYIHLNPTSDHLVEKPEDWRYSSYGEFIGNVNRDDCICNYSTYMNIDPVQYRDFVLSRVEYQQEISRIKDSTNLRGW